MKQINNIALLVVLLVWSMWLCLSVSILDKVSEVTPVQQPTETSKEHLHQEEQKRAIAWSEQTIPQSIAANEQELDYTDQLLSCNFFYVVNAGTVKASIVFLYFSTLTKQFRILPNAP